ncbi:hypothetical protein MFIFM68171_09749 [Madurella fahalii]|uniref:Cytochrome P450 n=1 Tax=Madurella fahalii TaxID=1157608 RepID=A0ABQ0GP99_9PEZI
MATEMTKASLLDDGRVLASVIAPTIAKGTIKRRPSVEALAQHHGLDTSALQLLQDLRRKYGSEPLLVSILFRSQVIVLDPKDVEQILLETPEPFSSASKEKRSALRHFEPGNILIADPEQRAQLRPVHEHTLATNERIHPLYEHFQAIINDELRHVFDSNVDKAEFDIDWTVFAKAWSRITTRLTLGDSARDDKDLIETLDDIRHRANWGFMALTDHSKLDHYQARVSEYLERREEGSLVSRLPKDSNLDLASQVAQWLFAFDAAALATYRALALLALHPEEQEKAFQEAQQGGADRPLTRGVFLESLRLWPTTPAILRELAQDHQINGKTVKKGTGVVIFTPFFHRDNEKLPFADLLSPEQWKDKEAIIEKGLVPFSFGPAICPAHNLVPMISSRVLDGFLLGGKLGLVAPELDPKALPGTLNNFEVKLSLTKRTSSA